MFKKDSAIIKYQAFEAFETFKRPSDMSEDVPLLKSANLSNHHEQLINATLPQLQYGLMKDQLKKTFSGSSRHVPTKKEDYIKTEEDLVAEMNQLKLRQEHYFDTRNNNEYYPFRDAQEDIYKPIENNFQSYENQNETFFNRNNYHLRNKSMYRGNQYIYQQAQSSNETAGFKQPLPKQYTKHKKNPSDRNGIQLRSLIRESVYHFAQNCPEAKNQDAFFSQEVVLFQEDYDHSAKLKNLVPESRNSAIRNSGASITVTGESWMNTYIEILDDQDKAKIVFRDSTNVYRFGDGKTILATRSVDIPVVTGS